jgi:hypothetical protein
MEKPVYTEQLTMEIDKASIRQYIRAVHEDDKDGRGFIVLAEKRKNGKWKQRGYTWDGLLQHIRKIDLGVQKNMYLSAQTFCAPYRRIETLFRLNVIGYDIDFHEGRLTKSAILNVFRDLKAIIFEENILPPPSLVVFTGRGLQLIYLLESLPKQGLPLWQMVGEAMAARIREGLSSTATVSIGALDANYSDVTRVLRLPGTYNTEARTYAEIIEPEDAPLARYRLDALRDAYLPELIPRPKGKAPPRPAKDRRVINLYNTYSLHMARLEDVVTLRNMRRAMDMPEDCRRRMVFLYRYWSCFCVGTEAALEAALAFNREFLHPLPENVVRQDTKSAETAYARWMTDRKKGYNYRNATLIELFQIIPEEQRKLKTIINADIKKERQKSKDWYHEKRDAARKIKKQEEEGAVLALLSQGIPQREIMRITSKSFDFIGRISKEYKKSLL